MEQKPFCIAHVNGFEHFDPDLGGTVQDFDLGIKFEQRESDSFVVDAATGTRAWCEPFLGLYVSVVQRGSERECRTFHYGMNRREFSGGLVANDEDKRELLRRALPRLRLELEELRNAKKPRSFNRFEML